MSKNRWARPSSSKKSRHGMVFEELEPRLLLSADLPLDLPAAFAPDSDDDSVPATVEVVESVTTPEEHTPRELVFVDTDTPDYELLLDDLLSNNETRQIEVVVLDNNSDGIAQISSALSQYRGLDAVHIISHGSEGSVDLGGSRLEFDTLLTNATAIKGWANAFSETGDLLIYGCNLAASADGQSLVDALGRLTGTDVAASDDLTGSAALGGDWDLEYRTGTIDTPAVVSSALQQQWNGLLEERTLLISTDSNVAAPGADGLSSGWTEGQVLNLGGPDLAHGVTTDGDLSIVIDFDNFTLDPVDTGALHFVSRDITVGGVNGTFDLKAGDVLVSFLQDETIVATYTNTGLNETYGDQDLLVFRPDSFGNYSSGTFYLLLDEVVADDLKGVTLVEQETSIGGAEVSAGSFLLIRESSATTSVDLFVPTGVGAGTTTGPVTPFIDLSTLGIDSNRLRGIELIEAATTVGGHGLAAGSLLATLNIDDNVTGVAGNNLLVDLNDVFVLNLSSIGPGNTSGTAAIFLDGSLVGLDDNPTQENPYALALYNYSQLVVDTASDVSDGDTSSITALMLDKGADGSISLREAIEATNATPNGDIADVIHFDIAGAHTIDVGNVADGNNGELPGITDAVIIDGTTDPDYAGTPIIVLDGSGAGAVDGLTLAAGSDGSTMRGLAINDFQGNGILVTGSSGNMMAGNHIGTDSTGMVDQGNGVTGIFVTNGAGNNTIGGLNAGDRNVVTGNSDDNIKIEATAGTGNTVIGNYIGVDAAGTSTLGNGGSGLDVQADGNTIGGATAEARNVISGSTFNGVAVSGDNNVIQGNFIGTDHTGTLDFGNGRNGVWISGGSNNLVGGAEAGAGNLIHGNSRNGVLVSNGAPTGNTILGNTIYGNDWIGIDLSTTTNGDGVTGNDDNDEDNGQPNELQNYPAITFAELDGTDLTLNGSLDTDGTGTQYHIEFFGNAAGTEDATNGEARVYLGTVTVTTDGSGDASFSGVTLAGVTLSAGDYVTATATRIEDPGQVGVDDQIAYGSTSEFAANLAITAVNAPPIAVADSFTVNEGSSTNLNLASNDTDADDGLDLTSITIVSGPTNGTIDSINVDGTVDYTHDGSETVADSFTYTIDDLATATSNTVTVSLTITPQNDAPLAVADSFTVNEGSTTNLNLAANDTDADDGLDLNSITIVSGPTNGTIDSINANGTVDYTHDGSETVADSFTYTIDDLAGATSNTVTVSLTVTPINDPPVAVADSFTVNEGSTTNLNLASNDTDADDGLDLASIAIVTGPTNGSVVVKTDGTVDYIHDGSETLADSFTYTIDDLAAATSNTVTVSLTITPVNDPPVAVADSFTVNEGSTTNLNLASNDSDADDGLDLTSITIVSGPTNGTIDSINVDGTVDYTHNGSETVADSFTYTIDDLASATSNTVTVSLTITPTNDAPVAAADSFTVNEGSTTNLNLASNDSDADDGLDLTSITIVSGPTNGTIDSINVDGTVDYTHDSSETVADSFTYTIDDLATATSNTVTVSLTITPQNDAPVAVADSFTVNEGSTTNLDLAVNDTDADDGLDLTSITIVSGPTSGTIDSINVDGTVDYTHDGSETIADSFTYTIDDLATATSNTVTVTLTITPVNDPPVAVVDSFTVNEGSTTNLNLASNDSDADDGLDLTSITIVSGPTNGTIDSINVDGTVDYTHNGSETVADSFTYTIDDLASATSNTVTVSLTITPQNDAPVAVADSFTVNEGSTTNLDLAGNDSDADDGLDLTSITIVSGPTSGTIDSINVDGTVDYTHNGSETVADSFTYTIDDLATATSNTVTVSLTITPQNDAPVAVVDSFTVSEGSTTNLDLAVNDTDADDGLDLTSITIVSGPTSGTIDSINVDGTVDYTHDGSETVADSFTYTIDDLAAATSNTVTVSLTITPVNDPPVAVVDSFTVNEGSTTNLNLAANDSDADDGLDLTSITIVSGPTNGTIDSINVDGTVDYTHDGSETVADSFTYTIDDLAGATSNTVTVTLTITPANDAPVATADSFTVNEGSTTNLDLAVNDTDADDGLDLTSITIVSGPTSGTIDSINVDGTVDYTHNGSETVADSFTYTIDDLATATSNTVTVSLTITPQNDAPVAVVDSFTVSEGSTTNLDLAVNDTDADDGLDLTSITIVSGPTSGTIDSINVDGTVDYTHDGSETVADSFTYTIDDLAAATSNTVTVSLTITPVNDPPVAVVDSFTVNEGSTTNLNLAANDSDADDGLDLTSITIVSGPTNGTIDSINVDGTVDYTHDGSETVADSFTYTIDDLAGATSNTVTVTLTITPANDAPVAAADSFTVNEGSTTNLDLAVNDTDADDGLDSASITIVGGPANGSIVVNANGTVDYTHDGSETVADSFTYTIDDQAGATSNTVTVSLTVTPVNDTPVATADSFAVNQGSTTNLNLAVNDTDADDGLDLTSISIVSGPANGTVVVNTDGTVDYTHDGSATVADSFTYTIDDASGLTSNTVTVSLTITLGNAAPVATDDSFTVNEGSTTNLSLAANDTDADDGLDLASITVVSGPSNGSVSVNANGTVDYTHDGSETLADSFTYTIDDLAGATSNTVTVSLTVTPVNDAPVATADSFAVNQGSTINLNLAVNDTDADDGLDLTSISIVSGPANGTVVVNTDGTVDYTHDASATVADSFTYTIDDLSASTSNTVTVGLTITLGNAAPVAMADSFTVNEGSTTNLNLAANDTDADDGLDLASITIVGGPTNGSIVVNANGTVDYTHDGSETVADSFTYTIDDLAGATSNTVTVSLTVTPVNDTPVATADSFAVNQGSTTSLNLAVNDTDADDGLDLTSIAIVSGPSNGTIVVNTDGTVDYTHDGSATVADSFTYTIDDASGATSNTVTVGLTITLGNAAPVATADSFTVNEGSTTNLNLAANDTDADDGLDLASITVVSGPSNGSVSVNANGTVDYTHDGSETLADSFTYAIDDLAGATSNTVTVSLTITPVNDAPIATADSFTVNQGSTTNLNLAVNDTDADDGLDLTSIAIVSGPANGSILVNTDGTVDYTHDGSATVADSFTYTIDDAGGATSNTVTVGLTITLGNAAPVATADSFTVNEGSTTNLNLAANDTDADDGLDLASITIVGGPTNGSIVINANGTVDYAHDGSETVADSFTYTIDDLAGATSNTVTVSLTVTPVNDAPIATADSFTVTQGSTTNLNLAVNDTDADDGLDLTSISIVSGPANGTVVVNTDGTVDYTHEGSATVGDSFTYTIDDLSGATSNTVTVGLTITLGNAAPVATADSFTVNEGSTTNLNLAANDTDADDGLDLASITIVGGPTNGSIVINANGTVDYTHDGSETVADSFTYTIDDLAGATSNTVTVSLTVTPVNDAPIATADSFTVTQGSTTNLNLAVNDTDADDGLDLTSISIVSGPANGTIVVNTDGTVDYTHDGSATVGDSFTYTIDDLSGATSNTVTVGLTITLGNAAPVATADSFTVDEGSTTNLNLSANDTDADDRLDLTSIAIVGGPTNGSIVVNANGTVDYTHDGSETLADSFTYTIDDLAGATSNTVTVSLTITPVNDAPVATADSFTVNEGSTTNLNLAANDTDADDGLDLTSITIVSGPTNGSIVVNTDGTVDYTHDGSATVADSFTYAIDDITGDTSDTVLVNLSIDPINEAPTQNVPTDQSTPVNTPLVFSSENGNSITVGHPDGSDAIMEVTLSTSNGTLSLTGTAGLSFDAGDGSGDTTMKFTGTASDINNALEGLTFQPDEDYEGAATVQIVTDDLGTSATGGPLNAIDSVGIAVTANAQDGMSLDALPPLDELIENTLDLPAVGSVRAPVDDANADLAAVGTKNTVTARSEPPTTSLADASDGTTRRLGGGVPTQIELSLPSSTALANLNFQIGDDNGPTAVQLVRYAIRQALADPLVFAKTLLPLEPDISVWEAIDAMMDQMDGDDESWYGDDQVLTTTTTTGLTVSFTVGYVSWLLRAGYLSASFMSILPLWSEFDPLPILGKTKNKKRDSDARDKDSTKNNDTVSEEIFASHPFPESRTISSETIR